MHMQSEQQQRIMGYFIEEAKDHLNTIEQGLLNLQNTIEDSEMVNEVFRAAHSVKGGAAMLGLSSIQRTSHRLEDYFKVLRECPIRVDQKLETLFLRVFDTLQELLDQLQGPFGLTEDKADEIMANVEPIFNSLHEHLTELVTKAGGAPPGDAAEVIGGAAVAKPQVSTEVALRQTFQTEVPAHLREMLQLFKQAENAASRQQLQELCQTLAGLGEMFTLSQWCELLHKAEQAVVCSDNSFKTLAPVLIRDIKRAQELILAGTPSDIICSEALEQLIPVEAAPEFIELSPEAALDELFGEADDAIATDSSLFLDGEPTLEPEALNLPAEDISFAAAETGDSWFDEAIAPDEQTIAAPSPTHAGDGSDSLDDLLAVGGSEPVRWERDRTELIDVFEDEPEEAIAHDPLGITAEPVGPEVGAAELNSLADLFEGEVADLGLPWDDEPGHEDPDDLLDALDLEMSDDFSDLLFDQDASAQPRQAEPDDIPDFLNLNAPDTVEPAFTPDLDSITNDTAAGPASDEGLDVLFDALLDDTALSNGAAASPTSDAGFDDLFDGESGFATDTEPEPASDLDGSWLQEIDDNITGEQETLSAELTDVLPPQGLELEVSSSTDVLELFSDLEDAPEDRPDPDSFLDSMVQEEPDDSSLEAMFQDASTEAPDDSLLESMFQETFGDESSMEPLFQDAPEDDAGTDSPLESMFEDLAPPEDTGDITADLWDSTESVTGAELSVDGFELESLESEEEAAIATDAAFDLDFLAADAPDSSADSLPNEQGAIAEDIDVITSLTDLAESPEDVSGEAEPGADALLDGVEPDLFEELEQDSLGEADLFGDVEPDIPEESDLFGDVEPDISGQPDEAIAPLFFDDELSDGDMAAIDELLESPALVDLNTDLTNEFGLFDEPSDEPGVEPELSDADLAADLMGDLSFFDDAALDLETPETSVADLGIQGDEPSLDSPSGLWDGAWDTESPEPAAIAPDDNLTAEADFSGSFDLDLGLGLEADLENEFDLGEATVDSTPDVFGELGELGDLEEAIASSEESLFGDDAFFEDGNLEDESLGDISAEEQATDTDFADLEALLDEDIPLPDVPAPAPATTVEDDFADLEALIGADSPASEPTPARASAPTAAEGDEFDDLEKLLEDAEQTLGGTPTSKARRGASSPAPRRQTRARPARAQADQNMRVSVKNLDNLNNLIGELVVNRNSLEQTQERLRQFLDNLLYQVQQLSDVGQRMRDLYERSLLESSLLSSRRTYAFGGGNGNALPEASHATGANFDALEMDRFTGFHTLSQEMIELIVRVRESASDIDFVVEESDQVTRTFRQVTTQLQEGLTRARMVPFAQTADRLPRAVRDISLRCGKQAELVVEGRDTLIDKMILEQLYDPMTHLVNNAITHGIETPEERQAAGKPAVGRITVRSFHQGNQTVISITDDGAGIDPERVKQKALEKGVITRQEAQEMSRLDVYDLLFHSGFSTRDKADDFAGRGVGMDVVRTNLNEIRGTITTDSTVGSGTTFTIRLPLTLSISKALCCISNRARIAFPMDGVEDMLDVPKERVQMDEEGHPCIMWRDFLLPFQPLQDLLTYNRVLGRGSVYGGQEEDIVSIVVLRSAGNFLALQVDQVLGEQEIVIKQLEGPVPKPVGIAGATVLGDGRIMPIADVLELIDLSLGRIRRDGGSALWSKDNILNQEETEHHEPTVLIVDDSITVRELLSMTFSKVGYRVEQARDGQEAWEKLRSGLPCDLVFCDIEMPRMDGLELLSRLQKDPNLTDLPIAMLTSRGADRHRQMAISLGAKGYFTKPYLEEVLLDAAQRMLKGEVLVTASS